jgi:hypothetical protein
MNLTQRLPNILGRENWTNFMSFANLKHCPAAMLSITEKLLNRRSILPLLSILLETIQPLFVLLVQKNG